MKMVRTALASLLVLVSIAGAAAAAPSGAYTDVPAGHWAHDVIVKWSQDERNVLEGTGEDAFAPEKDLTLGEVAALLSRYFGYTERTEAEVTPAWADAYIEQMIAAGVLDAAAQVNADAAVNREQAVMYFAKAFGIAPVEGDTAFTDNGEIDAVCRPYVNACQRLGYVKGTGGDKFDPKGSYTRAQAAQLLDNMSKPGITDVSALGFVDVDGAKLSAIAVEYNVDLTGADVSADTYELNIYQPQWNESCINRGQGSVGDITKVYVNDKPEISAAGGTGSGRYVIIEVYTDYLLGSEQAFGSTMSVGVTQKTAIQAGSAAVAPSGNMVSNYVEKQTYNEFRQEWSTTKTPIFGTYTIQGIEGFRYFTNNQSYGTPDGPAFWAENCFNEQDGTFSTVELSYALYVPADYNPNGRYALVTMENPAAGEGTHPMASVLETRTPSVLISDWAQNIVKEKHGLDGLIVVIPTVTQRVNDNACTPAQYEALVQLWDSLLEEYAIDENYIYGIGQSVGGMVLMETNRNRDNFFAGIIMFENQWAQNYYKDTLFVRNMASDEKTAATAGMHYPRTNDSITWNYHFDEQGQKVTEGHDPYNYYYLISDDNVLLMNRSSNYLSNDTWMELNYLYSDLVGYEIPRCIVDSTADIADQEAAIRAYLDQGSSFNSTRMGLNWVTFENGANGYSARKVDAGYEWLLSQSRQTEMARPKLDLNKPFELASQQIQDESRIVTSFTDTEGNPIYYLTAKQGAGTQFYNTCWLNLTTIADSAPGWLPEGMSWETGVKAAEIQGVTAIHTEGRLTAVAIQYSVDMANAVINLKGDEIIGLDGEVRSDIQIMLDPFEFYTAEGEKIDCEITNVYISSSASVRSGAERGSGSGSYLIVELDTDSGADAVGVIQRTTIHTNDAIASATATLYE